ncbi:MAG: type 3 dihydrofolate reductase [Woeseiaceae bacterium]|nr:type 3 dihydrofolate reductase [Woeseiaceae bacterium]
MRISLVVAASANRVIGKDGKLPWHVPADLQRFRAITMGHPIVMGRRTWESIGRPLPGRRNIVLTSNARYVAEGATVVTSPASALEAASDAEEVMIIGGGQVYELFLPLAERVYLTRIDATVDGDAFFPVLDAAEWRLIECEPHRVGDAAGPGFRFETLERRKSPVNPR